MPTPKKGAVPKRERPLEGRRLHTIPEFCEYAGIGETKYYTEKAEGRGPDEIRLGPDCVRITDEAICDWERKMAKYTAQIDMAKLEQRSQLARKAGKASVAARRMKKSSGVT